MLYHDYAEPDEVEEFRKSHFGLTKLGRLWQDEVMRRFVEGESLEMIALDLGIKPWQIQLLMTQE